MARDEEMTREFLVIYDFDRFHKGDVVNAALMPDRFEVEGEGKTLGIPYGEIEYVAHFERPDARASEMLDVVPFAFGSAKYGAFATEVAASFGIDAAEHAVAPNFYQNLFLVGYYGTGREESWVILQDKHTATTNSFAKALADRADTKVIHYFTGLKKKADL